MWIGLSAFMMDIFPKSIGREKRNLSQATSRRTLAALFLTGGAFTLLATLSMCRSTAGSAPSANEERTIEYLAAAEGVVEPHSQEISLAASVTGTVEKIMVTEGDHVAKGQIIAALRNDDLEARLLSAQAALDGRRAELEKLVKGARAQDRAQLAATGRGADAEIGVAATRLARIEQLAERGFVSRATLDDARYSFQSAKARQDEVTQRLSLINAPARQEDLAIARADLKVAERDIEVAAAEFDKTQIRSPINGTILTIQARPGEATSILSPTTIATVGDIDNLVVRAEIDEASIGAIRLGQTARIKTDAYPGRVFLGKIIRIADRMSRKRAPSADPQAQQDAMTLEVKIALQKGAQLPVGLRCDVFINRI